MDFTYQLDLLSLDHLQRSLDFSVSPVLNETSFDVSLDCFDYRTEFYLQPNNAGDRWNTNFNDLSSLYEDVSLNITSLPLPMLHDTHHDHHHHHRRRHDVKHYDHEDPIFPNSLIYTYVPPLSLSSSSHDQTLAHGHHDDDTKQGHGMTMMMMSKMEYDHTNPISQNIVSTNGSSSSTSSCHDPPSHEILAYDHYDQYHDHANPNFQNTLTEILPRDHDAHYDDDNDEKRRHGMMMMMMSKMEHDHTNPTSPHIISTNGSSSSSSSSVYDQLTQISSYDHADQHYHENPNSQNNINVLPHEDDAHHDDDDGKQKNGMMKMISKILNDDHTNPNYQNTIFTNGSSSSTSSTHDLPTHEILAYDHDQHYHVHDDDDDGKQRHEMMMMSNKLQYDDIKKYFGMPISVAAKEMKVGLTVLKKRCRELNIPRWPHRKIKSLTSLIHHVKEMGLVDAVEMLEKHKRMLHILPNKELTAEIKKLRQFCFKANYKKRKSFAFRT